MPSREEPWAAARVLRALAGLPSTGQRPVRAPYDGSADWRARTAGKVRRSDGTFSVGVRARRGTARHGTARRCSVLLADGLLVRRGGVGSARRAYDWVMRALRRAVLLHAEERRRGSPNRPLVGIVASLLTIISMIDLDRFGVRFHATTGVDSNCVCSGA